MNRLNFLRKVFLGTAAVVASPKLIAQDDSIKEYLFEHIFEIHDKNDKLVYFKNESIIYRKIEKSFSDRIDHHNTPTFLGVNSLSIPVKSKYKWEDFLPIVFYFENFYNSNQKFVIDKQYNVCFRFIKYKPDRMHIDLFLSHKY